MSRTKMSSTAFLGLCGLGVTVAVAPPVAAAVPARTGNEVVYADDVDRDGLYALLVQDLGSGRRSVVLPEDPTNKWLYLDPELSPDGSQILLSTDRSSGNGQIGIAVVNRDGGGFRRLTTPAQPVDAQRMDVAGAWSPDGSSILFSRLRRQGQTATSSIAVIPAAGGAVGEVPGASDGYTADWSPTGDKIVYATLQDPGRGVGPLFITGLSGTERQPLDVVGSDPAWSPDGSTIALSAVTRADDAAGKDDRRIVLVPAGGGQANTLSVTGSGSAEPSAAVGPSWAPDSESLLYETFGYDAAGVANDSDLWAVDRLGVRAGRVVGQTGDQTSAYLGGPTPDPVSPAQASTFTPVTPVRILDTRNGTGVAGSRLKIGPGGAVRVAVRGVQTSRGRVPDSATGAILNVTVTAATLNTDVRVYPSGGGVPVVSNLNVREGQTIPNLVTATLGSDGSVIVRNNSGTVHLIADLAGWYSPESSGDGIGVVNPGRILDTRTGFGGAAGRVGAGGTLDLKVTGGLAAQEGDTVTVPDTATAVILNVSATGASAQTDVRVYPTPTDGSFPVASNLNLVPGESVANLVTASVGDGGRIRLRNNSGSLHLLADIVGFYGPDAPGRYVPVAPTRFLDTRSGQGAAPIPANAGEYVDLRSDGYRGIPADTAGVFYNLTATGGSTGTNIRAYPTNGARRPFISQLVLGTGATRANAALVQTGEGGRVRIQNTNGRIHLIADLAGYVVGAAPR